MKKNVFVAATLSIVLLSGALACDAAQWVKNNTDIPNKNVEANYYDGKSVKVRKGILSWTEKTILTDFGSKYYTKHLSSYPACQKNIEKMGAVTHHQIDLEIRKGKFRTVAKRNYNNADQLVCTDKDMGTELNKSWQEILYQSPIYFREYELVTKYNLGEI
ncbi:hypothetical protein OR1_00297 [Geobacter sp. OR-1]|uniref:hypothetical protein n=1 Tax=Geobacter sp. OR-1 TaxID=1266765 RepID=UPI000543DFF7|nr:hypothetical protein [Geobacter sp. OR-1]GAM08027.1 hypothetical protein OR1_00297 [Geobacter sp. OR-1]